MRTRTDCLNWNWQLTSSGPSSASKSEYPPKVEDDDVPENEDAVMHACEVPEELERWPV